MAPRQNKILGCRHQLNALKGTSGKGLKKSYEEPTSKNPTKKKRFVKNRRKKLTPLPHPNKENLEVGADVRRQ